jgi:hypothetical protein
MKNTKNAKANEINETVAAMNETVAASMNEATEVAKGAFDFMLETQTKFVGSLMDGTKKLAETFKATEAIEKSRSFVNEWLEKQQTTIENSVETLKKQVKFESAPELVKVAVEAQQELGKAWFEALRATLKVGDVKELSGILNSNVEKLQENVKSVANYWVENFGKPVNFTEVFSVEYVKDVTKKLVDMTKPAGK